LDDTFFFIKDQTKAVVIKLSKVFQKGQWVSVGFLKDLYSLLQTDKHDKHSHDKKKQLTYS